MKPRIGMVAIGAMVIDKTKEVAQKQGIHIEIRVGSLERAIPVAKQLEAEGIEVIICGANTADILKEHLSIPTISIPGVSAFDLLENISKVINFSKSIGICVYDRPLSGVGELEKLLQVKIMQVVYHDFDSLLEGVHRAKKLGVDVLMGRSTAAEICRRVNMPFIIMGISEEVIVKTINEATLISCIHRKEKEKTKRIEAILNSVSEGMIAIDSSGQVMVLNQMAKEILDVKEDNEKHVDELVSQMGLLEVLETGTNKLQNLQRIGETQVISNLVPVYFEGEVIGAIASFTDVTKLMNAEQKVRRSLTRGFVAKYTLNDIVHKGSLMEKLIVQTRQFAHTDSTILLTGESGTGKELFAHSIHNLSARKEGPFVAINCSSLSDNLLESELFGYEEGAFTGAKKSGKKGLFELAHKGTIFLDEIGSISAAVQSHLLRVLQQKEVMRIAGDRMTPVDVRIIAATNMDLLRMVKDGQMRIDLYFRLNVFQIHVPPLRERKEDIPFLVASFMQRHSRKYGKRLNRLPKGLMERFLAYDWPGNVRELDNFINKFVAMVDSSGKYEEVLDQLFEECLKTKAILFEDKERETFMFEEPKNWSKDIYKKEAIAKMMGISRTTLWRRRKRNR
jgi:transcriptional regulator with PAS, ATPase and Fis domain